jgi:D-3-phosphoglycerate dehydrogenase
MKITDFKNKHKDKPAFCLGTAPHLKELDLEKLGNSITIGCNQLIKSAEKYNIDYICIQNGQKFKEFSNDIENAPQNLKVIVPEKVINSSSENSTTVENSNILCPVKTRFTSSEHAEFFSFDLNSCVYYTDVIAMEIQAAVWMGCNPIYVIGVDAEYQDEDHAFYDSTTIQKNMLDRANKYTFPDLKEWLKKVHTLLWARGIRLYDAGGNFSLLDVIPKMHFSAATGSPKIAVTSRTFCQDDYLVNELKRYFPDVKLNESKGKLAGDDLVEFLSDADGMILGTEPFDRDVIDKLPCLRFVSKYGVGINNIDFEAATRNLMQVTYQKGVNSDSVAELTMAFALMLLRKIDNSICSYRNGKWAKLPGKELAEITVGIIGYGHVGKVVADKFSALGAGRLLVNDLLDFPVSPPQEFVPIDYLLTEADIITVHIDMENRNYHLFDKEMITKMKDGAILINTSRGGVVEEKDLADALKSGKLSGAALDVFEMEPEINNILEDCPNLLTTCHMAGSSNRAIKNMGWASIEGLCNLFNIEPSI